MKHTLKCIVHIETHFLNEKCKYLEITGAQPGKFQDTWYFLEWRHFDKHFINNRPTRSSTQKNFLKSAFQMTCLTYRCTQSAYLFSKPGHFFDFQKGAGEASPVREVFFKNSCYGKRCTALSLFCFGEFLRRSLFLIKLLLPTLFTLQLAILL